MKKRIVNKKLFDGYTAYREYCDMVYGSSDVIVDFFRYIDRNLSKQDLLENKKIINEKLLLWPKDCIVFCYLGYRSLKELENLKYFKYQMFNDLNYICGLAHFQKKRELKIERNIINITKNNLVNRKKNIENIKKEKISILEDLLKENIIEEEQFEELIKKMNLSDGKYKKTILNDCSMYIKSQIKKILGKKNKCSIKNFENYRKNRN